MPRRRNGGPEPGSLVRGATLFVLAGLTAIGCLNPARKAFFASCGSDDECESTVCWQGFCSTSCQSAVECGGGPCTDNHCAPKPLTRADAGGDVTPIDAVSMQPGAKRVFVSSKNYSAALGGLAGADSRCQSLADAAKLGGTYKSWLSDTTASPATRFSAGCKSGGPFVLVDGRVIAQDWAALTSGTLQNPLTVTEKGGAPPTGTACADGKGTGAWTATLNNGEVDKNRIGMMCADWTSGSVTLKASAMWGIPADPKAWSANGNCFLGGMTVCSRLATLYCFEQ